MSLQINTPEAYKRLINNNVSKSVSLSKVITYSQNKIGLGAFLIMN